MIAKEPQRTDQAARDAEAVLTLKAVTRRYRKEPLRNLIAAMFSSSAEKLFLGTAPRATQATTKAGIICHAGPFRLGRITRVPLT